MTPEQFEMLKQVNAKLDTIQPSLADQKTLQDEFAKLETMITTTFAKLETAQKETHTIVEEIGNTSQGRFKFKRPPAGKGGAAADNASDIDY